MPAAIYSKSGYIPGYDGEGKPFIVKSAEGVIKAAGEHPRFVDDDGNDVICGENGIPLVFSDSFFDENYLLCARCEVGSGAISVRVEAVSKTQGKYSVTFIQDSPDAGMMMTCDMTYWTAFIPILK